MNQPISADAWVATELGDPAKVLARQSVEVRAPGPGEIRVAVNAFCLNFNDIDIIGGRYTTLPLQPPFVPGMETVGVVESAGQGAEHLIGRRIVGIPVMAFGGYASYAIVDAATALDLPDWVSDVDGAALHYPFHLGWFALRERGRLQPGETLLVHAAAGGTGSGALVLGKALGAGVIATAGSDEKLEFCKELGADHVINYRNDDWVEQVVELTYGRGAPSTTRWRSGARWASTGRPAPRDSTPTRRSWRCCVPERSAPLWANRWHGLTCRMPWNAWLLERRPAVWWSPPADRGQSPGSNRWPSMSKVTFA